MNLFTLLGTVAIENTDAISAISQTTDEAEKAESKMGKAFSSIGKAAVAVGKVIATGLAVATTAIAGLVSSSISAYADYEQLVGGVETLFKDSASQIQDYADRAYETAGLSANEYMETVTSFSASLLQSLGNDTVAAAEKADKAITDMADNANKMGSSMESIQNAYQGFAKQNYTMLDNLKLGYGGTKEEMARLLEDAEKFSGIKYDLSSYADIVDAIHVIQTEMGITGTTAKEAASTISGSIASMKSQWQNLLTALSGDGWDLGVYISNFVDTVSTVADNLLPRIEIALGGVVTLIQELAPKIISVLPGLAETMLPVIIGTATTLIETLVSILPSLFETLLPVVIGAATSLIGSLVSVFPSLVSTLLGCIPDLLSAVESVFGALLSALPSLVESISSALPTLIPLLINALVSMGLILASNLLPIVQPLLDNLPDIIVSITSAMVDNLPLLIDGVIALILGIVQATPLITSSLIECIPIIIQELTIGLLSSLPQLLMGIIDLFVGLVVTLPQMLFAPIEGAINSFIGLWDGIKDVFAPVADWFGTNVIPPVVEFFTGLWQSMQEIWDNICAGVSFAIELISSILSAAFQIITLPFQFIWENCKQYVFDAWEWIKQKIQAAITFISGYVTTAWAFIRDNIVTPVLDLKDKVVEAFGVLAGKAVEIFDNIKIKVTDAISTAKTKILGDIETLKTNIQTKITAIQTKVTTIFNSIKEKMTKPITDAKDKINTIVQTVKGYFSGMNLQFPHIKLPHFSITPSGWQLRDLFQGSIPTLGIEWYAKAMDEPMVMTQPTVFGYNAATGQLRAGGEAGSEVVSGTNTLMNMISAAVAGQNQGLIEVLYRILEAILAMDENMGGNMRDALVGTSFELDNREFGRLVRKVT